MFLKICEDVAWRLAIILTVIIGCEMERKYGVGTVISSFTATTLIGLYGKRSEHFRI